MPATNTTLDTGLMKTQEFAQRFPAIATTIAQRTNSTAGKSVDVGTALVSDPGQESIGRLFSGNEESYNDLLNFKVPETAGKSIEDATTQLFGAKEQNLRAGITAKRSVLSQLEEVGATLDKFTSFNKASYTKKRLKELDPISDLDEQIAEVRQQMFVEDIRIDNDPEMNNLSPAQRSALRASAQEKYINTITELSSQRKVRLENAQNQIDDEISANDDQINTSNARISALTRTLNTINDLGKDNEAMASIRMDLIKEQDRLKKLRGKAGGKAGTAYSTQKEMAKIFLKEEYAKKGKKINDDEVNAIVEAQFLRALGDKSLTGVKGSETMTVDTNSIEPPPEFQEVKTLSPSERISALDKLQSLDTATLRAVGGGDAAAGRKLLLESIIE